MPRPDRTRRARSKALGLRKFPGTDVVRNRRFWDWQSDQYDRRFAGVLSGKIAMAWGLWRIPEADLRLLGDVRGKSVLELGCGAARWSKALARLGAEVVGVDFSAAQLAHARRVLRTANGRVSLVRSNVQRLPFRPNSFDVVFCDWGGLTFADPLVTVPECARVLRRNGIVAFTTGSPIGFVGHDLRFDRHVRRFVRPYFEIHRIDFGDEVNFQLPYGSWVELFARNNLTVERMIETRPPLGAPSAYLSRADGRWGHSWPLECIWKVRKMDSRGPSRRANSG